MFKPRDALCMRLLLLCLAAPDLTSGLLVTPLLSPVIDFACASAKRRPTSLAESKSTPSPLPTVASLAGFEVAALSLPGTDPDRPQKVNQDAYFTFDTAEMVGIGVMDGHGLKGHDVTAYLRQRLPMRIEEQIDTGGMMPGGSAEAMRRFCDNLRDLANYEGGDDDDDDDDGTRNEEMIDDGGFARVVVRKCLINAFHLAHVDALESEGVPAGRAGTTCVVAAISLRDCQLYTAIVGDSRGILVEREAARTLTEETTTKIPKERARMEASEGRLDELGNVYYGPVGIAMTRSLGNAVMLRAGVVPTPVVTAHGTMPPGSTVVLGTDGIFDVLSSKDVMEGINSELSLEDAIVHICQLAKDRWQGGLPVESKVDDITCVGIRRMAQDMQ